MANIISIWNELLLEAIRQTKPGPPMVARSIAIVHTAIYDAWAAYDPVAKQTRADFKAGVPNTPENVATSISYAAYRSLVDQFSAAKSLFDEKMTQLGLNIGQTSNNSAIAWGVGNKASKNVLNYRHTDGANQVGGYGDTTGYIPANNPIKPFFATTVSMGESISTRAMLQD